MSGLAEFGTAVYRIAENGIRGFLGGLESTPPQRGSAELSIPYHTIFV